MPDSAATDRSKTALALSGGGFRATLFHLGTLTRLNELKLLGHIERISSVSGGSIAAGLLAKAWSRLDFKEGRATKLNELVIDPVRAFCGRNIDKWAIFKGAALPGKRIGDVLAEVYDELLDGMTLEQLPERPQFVFKATNLQTGRLFRFSKRRLADYRIGEIPYPKGIPLAVAVAASSAFPPFLSPVELELDPALWRPFEGADLFGDPAYHKTLYLTDGGAYDNLGLETIDDFKTILVSDAGAPFGMEPDAGTWWHRQALRALDIATDQSRGLRKRLLVAESAAKQQTYAYWSIEGDITAYGVADSLKCDPGLTASLAHIRTRLNSFSEEEQGRLVNWGYALSDAAVRRYVLHGQTADPPRWPVPGFPLGA
jgi:NTE family protein